MDSAFDWIVETANNFQIPVMTTTFHLSHIMAMLGAFLANKLAPTVDIHGSFMLVYGVGVMIIGKSVHARKTS